MLLSFRAQILEEEDVGQTCFGVAMDGSREMLGTAVLPARSAADHCSLPPLLAPAYCSRGIEATTRPLRHGPGA